MPFIPRGNYTQGAAMRAMTENHGYKYPLGLKLHPKSEKHKKLLNMVLDRADTGVRGRQGRESSWDRVEDTLQAYIPLSDAETKLRSNEPNKPVSIVIPYSYATRETLLTYLVMAFLMQKPVFQYEAVSSEDTIAVKMMEVLVQRQFEQLKGGLSLYTWWGDGLAYGVGALAPIWKTERRRTFTRKPSTRMSLAGSPVQSVENIVEDQVLFEGTDLVNIGPRYLLLDPNTSAHRVQNSEFFGWVEETNQQQLLRQEKESPNQWFNAKYLLDSGPCQSLYAVNSSLYQDTNTTKPLVLVHMYVDLIPREWELNPADDNKGGYYPERYLITVADDWCIVRLEPLNSSMNRYPLALNAPDFDGYSAYPLSRLELIDGLQTVLNWLFNSHIANVRKVMNNQLVVDPSLIEVRDLRKSREGGIIRLRSNAWGKDIKNAVHQLAVTDVTGNHIRDAEAVVSMMQRVGAATDNIMGIPRQGGERVSATESRSVAASATNRLEKIAALISMQGMHDLSTFMAVNTQDFMSQDMSLRVLGSWPQELIAEYGQGKNAKMSISDLNVPFDISLRDGSLPIDTTGVSESWIQLFQVLGSSEQLGARFDTERIFLHIARLLGAKNVQDFRIQPTVMPDQDVLSQVDKGNLVAAEQLGEPYGV